MPEKKRGPRPVGVGTGDDNATVRQTVDLPERHHNALARWRLEAALNLGVTRVTTQHALNELVALLLEDPEVAQKTLARLASRYEQV